MSQPGDFTITTIVLKSLNLRILKKSGWVGRGMICPRSSYVHARKKRDEFNRSGVYLLIGIDEESGADKIYIGESDRMIVRLDEHVKDEKKGFWQKAIIFTTDGEPLNKAQIQYLESELIKRATASKKCDVANKTEPNVLNLSESDEIVIQGYLEEMLSLLPVISIDMFTSPSSQKAEKHDESSLVLFKFEGGKKEGEKWRAEGYETATGFIVMKGSQVRKNTVSSYSALSVNERNRLKDLGVLRDEGSYLVFTQDFEFSAPSPAAEICAGRPSNGRDEWKNKDGESLNDIAKKQLQPSESDKE